ncbi:MAG: class I SAM-dependent methyltransferase [Oscillochloris sp.]|nr:class I SAM-dependent methyltransferase [Oscillochloris sp.]
MGVVWFLGAGLGAAILYWLVVIGEGTYIGTWAVRLIYQLGASHYDRVHAASSASDAQYLLPILHTALADITQPQVLDVATGTGRVPLLLAREATFVGRIIGVDLTSQMIAQARQKHAASCPQAAIHWQVGEAGYLAWPGTYFDLVCCLEAIEYFPDPPQALAEMARVLRPGATLVISIWPDTWARVLPGRAFTRAALRRYLGCLGFGMIDIRSWQPGNYDLVTARKW